MTKKEKESEGIYDCRDANPPGTNTSVGAPLVSLAYGSHYNVGSIIINKINMSDYFLKFFF